MQIETELSRFAASQPTLVTLGVFDGVHLGHQHLFGQLLELSRSRGLQPCVVTFTNHPLTVLKPEIRISYLCTPDERLELVRALGISHVVPLAFTHEVSQLTAKQFLLLLQRHLKMAGIVAGPDFAMGKDRQGDIPTLKALGAEMGFTLDVAEPRTANYEVISSTAIRRALEEGDLERARASLGRPFILTGPVVSGFQRGRDMGFPTANIAVPLNAALPKDGIYATRAIVEGGSYLSATSIGVRPTFGPGGERTVEVYILDFRGDLYGKTIKIEMIKRMRDELRFNSVQELIAQIEKDVAQVRAILG